MNNTKVMASLALGSLMTLSGCANNPFAAEPMNDGYQQTSKKMEASCSGKKVEGSCSAKKAEGSCSDKKMEGSCADKNTEGSCSATSMDKDMKKKIDGKCGEAKCGS